MKNLKVTLKFILALCLMASTTILFSQRADIDNFRSYDKNGLNIFETPKDLDTNFDGIRLRIGGAFTQQYQGLSHENAPFSDSTGVINPLYALGNGFNLATANLNIDVQLADGVALNMITYLSSRHHAEAWVKGGYIQFDKLPFFKSEAIDKLMQKVTIKVGHMEVNYGDAHFRRTDNGNAIYNPFVGNYLIDGFNTEIGGEIYYRSNGFIGMLGLTGGEINGNVADLDPNDIGSSETDDKLSRSPSILGKLGYDKQINEDLRFRLTGSMYYTASSSRNHMLDGDRGGSRYYLVMSAPGARAGTDFRTGRYNPSFGDELSLLMGNVFLKYQGFELFGIVESGSGKSSTEPETRNYTHIAADLLYRFGSNENAYIGGRYNTVTADDVSGVEVTINRMQFGAGWFLTDNILAKLEYVNQEYKDFAASSRFAEGKFNGIMIEAVVGF
ncbi:MAG: hypothetical protein P1U56_21050 [Saprospiraceae bacterium]|nr:hypothetical protein [Saprospiraceae bacterium]